MSTKTGQLVKYSNSGVVLGRRGQLGIVIASGGFPPVWASNAGHQADWYRVRWLEQGTTTCEMWERIELLTETTDESR